MHVGEVRTEALYVPRSGCQAGNESVSLPKIYEFLSQMACAITVHVHSAALFLKLICLKHKNSVLFGNFLTV